MEKIVVTGMGIIGPCGNSIKEFWQNLQTGQSNIRKVNEKGIQYAGVVHKDSFEDVIPRRLLIKCARFSKLGLVAIDEAIKQANFKISDYPDKVGVFIGNNSAGWDTLWDGFNCMKNNTPLSPHLVSNWFPAAVQGHASLMYGMKGISKTIVADRVSGLMAIKNAIKYLRKGTIDFAIVGGVEAPVNSMSLEFYDSINQYSRGREYRLFAENEGMVIAEGAGFLILEREENALKRLNKKSIMAQIDGIAVGYSGDKNEDKSLSIYQHVIQRATDHHPIEVVYLSGIAKDREDKMEVTAIQKELGKNIVFCCPKTTFGHTVGASAPMDIILSILSMKENIVLKTHSDPLPEADINREPTKKHHATAWVLSQGYGGVKGAIQLSRYN